MHFFDIHPRPTGDGYDLTGEMIGGAAGSHWFRSVREAAVYAWGRCGLLDGGGVIRIYNATGSLRSEHVVEGGTGCLGPRPTPGQPATGRWC